MRESFPMHQHAKLIDKLGGPTLLKAKLKLKESRQAVSAWKTRGIPFKHRFRVAELAKTMSIKTPKSFLG